MSDRSKRRPKEEMILKPPPEPSIDDLIAEARRLGEFDLIKSLERMRKWKRKAEASLRDD